jgi:hypothetical protein
MKRPVYIDTPLYVAFKKDSDHDYLDGSKHRYILKFDNDHLPPNVFWSMTLYRLSGHFRKNDPVRRYLIHSPMFSSLSKDDDGGLTIYLQRDSPGLDKETNWLPPPRDLFFIVMRMYLPMKGSVVIDLDGPHVEKLPEYSFASTNGYDLVTADRNGYFNNIRQFRIP